MIVRREGAGHHAQVSAFQAWPRLRRLRLDAQAHGEQLARLEAACDPRDTAEIGFGGD